MRGVGAGAAISHAFSPTWTRTVFTRYERLVVSAARSPIVTNFGQRDQVMAGIGFTYSFRVDP